MVININNNSPKKEDSELRSIPIVDIQRIQRISAQTICEIFGLDYFRELENIRKAKTDNDTSN